MSQQIDLKKYSEFVYAVTSEASKNLASFTNRLNELDNNYEIVAPTGISENGPEVNVPLMVTGALGMGAECGELQEIVKKMLFQGKPLTEDNIFHMKRELGDIAWYWTNACRALGLDPNDVIAENVNKLKARYPGGEFDPFYSENRKQGDL